MSEQTKVIGKPIRKDVTSIPPTTRPMQPNTYGSPSSKPAPASR